MQYGGGMPVMPGMGGGMGGPSGGMGGGGQMPTPGGPQGGGGAPMPRQAGPQMPGGPQGGQGGGGGLQRSPFSYSPGERMMAQQGNYQGGVDDAMMDLRRAQIMGADPMVIARLEQEANQAQRGFEQWQQRQYAEGMGQMSQRGPGGIGGGQGQSQLDQNPYLQMLLQSQLGMGGGGGGGESYGRGGMPGSY